MVVLLSRASSPTGWCRVSTYRCVLISEATSLARCFTAPVPRLFLHRRLEPLAHRVARQTRQSHDLPNRLLLAEMHPLDLANHGHGDHSFSPAQQRGRVG